MPGATPAKPAAVEGVVNSLSMTYIRHYMDAGMAYAYPIRAVAKLTGITIDTLRAWERRYQAVVPERGERGRVYRIAHVTRLKRLDTLVRQGHAIGSIAQLSDRHLTKMIARADAHAAPTPGRATVDLKSLIEAVHAFDLPSIDADLNRFATLLPPPDFIRQVALPLLRELGDRWQAGALRPAHEHLISSVVRTVLGGLLRTTLRGSVERTIVFATPAGEHHELGVLAAAVLAAEAGYHAIYLGPDLPAQDIATVAKTSGASAIVVGATLAKPAKQVARLARLAPKTVLLVGGPRAAAAVHGAPRAHHVADLDAFGLQLRQLIR